jgi:hypothetical protein
VGFFVFIQRAVGEPDTGVLFGGEIVPGGVDESVAEEASAAALSPAPTWRNSSNTASWSSGAMPMPVSVTEISAVPWRFCDEGPMDGLEGNE